MKWILLQKWSRFVPFFFTPFLELNLLLENNSVIGRSSYHGIGFSLVI